MSQQIESVKMALQELGINATANSFTTLITICLLHMKPLLS